MLTMLLPISTALNILPELSIILATKAACLLPSSISERIFIRLTVINAVSADEKKAERNNKIIIWNLKRDKSVQLNLNIGIKDFKKIKKIAKKTKCKVKIIKKKGLPFLFNRYKKRKIFFGFLLLILILIGIKET